ncbi:MAG: decaprenyl-phosphate phosphoribosyltransferase [Halanaerobiaceae bacterium]
METKISSLYKNKYVNVLAGILISMRPGQWTKNLLIFAGIIFSENFFNIPLLIDTIIGFFVFSLVSGSVYLVNDINDMEADKKHPTKRFRPLPSGRITIRQAVFSVLVLLLFSTGIAFIININFGLITLAYFLLVTLYSLYLKNIVIIDILTIASGFVLRAVAGVFIVETSISPWLIVCTILLALFLTLGKRRHEITVLKEEAGKHRQVLEHYSVAYLEQLITIVTAATIIAYSLYTFNSEKSIFLMFTIPFVIYGIFRYLYLIHQHNKGGSPEAILLEDKPLLINIIAWVLVSLFILYYL